MRKKEFISEVRYIIRKCLFELNEATELISLVVKAKTEQEAENAVKHLKASQIDARVKHPARFNPYSHTEVDGWGVFVRPSEVQKAADHLSDTAKGLSFDPVVDKRLGK